MQTTLCDKHVVSSPPGRASLKRIQTFRKLCHTFVDIAELEYFRRTATFRGFYPRRQRIHIVWDFRLGKNLPPVARTQPHFIKPNNPYILVTFTRSNLEQAFWIPYLKREVERQNPQYILCKIGSLQVYNSVLCSLVNFSNLPFSDRMCVPCLMERYECDE